MIKKYNTKKFNISNSVAYILIGILSFILIGIGVYAYGGSSPSAVGHSMGEIAWPSCSSSGQALTWNGNSWACIVPSGTDTRLTVNANGVCFTAPESCYIDSAYCYYTKYLSPVYLDGVDCGTLEQTYIDEMCYGSCYSLGYACDGRDYTSGCPGGEIVPYSASGYCSNQYYIECICRADRSYDTAVYVPSGTRCL